jgi:hypothetical protein
MYLSEASAKHRQQITLITDLCNYVQGRRGSMHAVGGEKKKESLDWHRRVAFSTIFHINPFLRPELVHCNDELLIGGRGDVALLPQPKNEKCNIEIITFLEGMRGFSQKAASSAPVECEI